MMSRRSRRLDRPSATLAALLVCAAGAAAGCSDSSYEDAPSRSGYGGGGKRMPNACGSAMSLVLLTTREALEREAGADASRLSVRVCIDSSCEDMQLDAAYPWVENDQAALAFDLTLDGLDPLAGTHLAAVSVYASGQKAPYFTDVREFSYSPTGGCRGFSCSTCPPSSLAFEMPGAAPQEPCASELVVSVQADEAFELASPTLFAEVCVDSICQEAKAFLPEALPPKGGLITVVVPLDAKLAAGGEHVVKLSLGYEAGSPLYADERLMSLDPGAIGCERDGEPDVVFSIDAEALPTQPTPRPLPGSGASE